VTEIEFTEYLFRRPEDVEWYFEGTHEDLTLAGSELVLMASRVFQDIGKISEGFSEKQICVGLRYLIDSTCSSACFSFLDSTIPADSRLQAIESMYYVFKELFSQHCKQDTRFEALPDGKLLTFAETCYLWWDIFPRHGVPVSPDLASTDSMILQTLEKILSIENFCCQKSALHGLGHWVVAQPEEVERIVQKASAHIPVDLRVYALSARTGDIQ
jgi:hypothetical protein